ncbi:MAG: hypothetical protein ABEI57_03025 [Halapricum sp.]
MRIITTTCPNCGTIVSGNLLEEQRVLTCPGYRCDAVLSFEDLSEADRRYVRDHPAYYEL